MTEISRIIPAYAGSTPHAPNRPVKASDHPRIRGEHQMNPRTKTSMAGSSPHTRGAPRSPVHPGRRRGIIPAYAGSTPGRSSRADAWRDHPRIRGEHDGLPLAEWRRAGSSPHTRGARPGPRKSGAPLRDHPRIRGEHPSQRLDESTGAGSSPHTRGAHRPACS